MQVSDRLYYMYPQRIHSHKSASVSASIYRAWVPIVSARRLSFSCVNPRLTASLQSDGTMHMVQALPLPLPLVDS